MPLSFSWSSFRLSLRVTFSLRTQAAYPLLRHPSSCCLRRRCPSFSKIPVSSRCAQSVHSWNRSKGVQRANTLVCSFPPWGMLRAAVGMSRRERVLEYSLPPRIIVVNRVEVSSWAGPDFAVQNSLNDPSGHVDLWNEFGIARTHSATPYPSLLGANVPPS